MMTKNPKNNKNSKNSQNIRNNRNVRSQKERKMGINVTQLKAEIRSVFVGRKRKQSFAARRKLSSWKANSTKGI